MADEEDTTDRQLAQEGTVAALMRGRTPCFVYLIVAESPFSGEMHDLFKVGISGNPKARLASLKTASPFPLSMPFVWRLPSRDVALCIEKEFHSENIPRKTSGEWFLAHVAASACNIDYSILWYHRRAIIGKADDDDLYGADIDDLLSFLLFVGMDIDHARNVIQASYGEEAFL